MMAQVCHYVMLHAADSQFVGNPEHKKQYGLKAGLRRFADRGNTAVMKELTQFHTMNVFRPMNPTKLTREDRRNALLSLMFLTEKRSGEVKARTCANGSVQRTHIAKEEAMVHLRSHRRQSSYRQRYMCWSPYGHDFIMRTGTPRMRIRSRPCPYAYGDPHLHTAIPICILSHIGIKSLISLCARTHFMHTVSD
jgi:hypothetical protein